MAAKIYAYYESDSDDGYIKIGKTGRTVNDRIREVKTGNPRELIPYKAIVMPYENSKVIEDAIYEGLKDFNVRDKSDRRCGKEWYKFDVPKSAVDKLFILICKVRNAGIAMDLSIYIRAARYTIADSLRGVEHLDYIINLIGSDGPGLCESMRYNIEKFNEPVRKKRVIEQEPRKVKKLKVADRISELMRKFDSLCDIFGDYESCFDKEIYKQSWEIYDQRHGFRYLFTGKKNKEQQHNTAKKIVDDFEADIEKVLYTNE